eukprot:366261-Chlamydomonas_euryale.AAC.4
MATWWASDGDSRLAGGAQQHGGHQMVTRDLPGMHGNMVGIRWSLETCRRCTATRWASEGSSRLAGHA